MLKSETGMPNERGFTLIEILVVILIVGIAASVTLLAFGDFGASRRVQLSAEQFVTYLKLVQQRAILEMNTLGVNINKDGYGTYRFVQAKTWEPMPGKSLFHWQTFPKSIHVSLKTTIKNNTKSPDIIISPTGNLSAFTLSFGTETEPDLVSVIGAHNGEVIIRPGKK
ncbi:general secretion pathway protein LspH [Legionella birminghamensis]|uniref:Type II secretion system protein H n=2 Tax=Legionella birminghamensis TaxID=28083 RepID=A0A378IAI2_9GAMM|nr:general secretion pathway protein LspH [Legionella birminghamensis]STX31792.1 general secretion pathway protein LspH [Legionella birminghamensis]